MTTTVVIRDYQPADLDAVVALVRELQQFEQDIYDRLIPAADIGPWYVERLQKDCAKQKGRILVAISGERVVGYATIMTDVLVDDERDEIVYSHAYLGDLAVTAGMRGCGIGQRLMAECEAIARAAGAKWLRITAHADNTRARRIYERFGFREQFVNFEKPLATE